MTTSNKSLSLTLVLASMLLGGTVAEARGFGGFHGGGLGGGVRGGGMPEGLAGGGMPGRLGGAGLGGGALAGRAAQLGLGGGGPSSLRSELGGGGGGLAGGGLSGLESRLPNGGAELRNLAAEGGLGGGDGLGGGGSLRNAAADMTGGERPSAGQLKNFLGLPSDHGLQNLSGETQSRASQAYDKIKEGDGPFSGFISGQTQKPGSRLYDKVKDGDGRLSNFIPGETQSRASQAYDKIKEGDGPFKNFIPGETQKPLSRLYDQIRAGNHPLRPWSPWWIHNNAIIIRRNFNAYFFFTPAWYAQYPYAWVPPVWYYGSPWVWAPWPKVASWCDYSAPIYYDFGNNLIYQDDSVTFNGTNVGTPADYANQAEQIADLGVGDQTASAKEWMSLGVFAVTKTDQKQATMVMQLAVDKQGIIRGNYTNTSTKDTKVIHGAVDKETQRAAWTIGDHKEIILDTGIYNLTKDETSVLVHEPGGKTEQWLMVRIKEKDGDAGTDKQQSNP